MYRELVEHKEKWGHCFDVPENYPLGKWLYRQRWLYRHGNLREDRAEKLLEIGFEDKKVLKKNVDGGTGGRKRKRKRSSDNGDEEGEGEGEDLQEGDEEGDGGDAEQQDDHFDQIQTIMEESIQENVKDQQSTTV